MIRKRIVEIFTLVFYWCIITPLIAGILDYYKVLKWDENTEKWESIRIICGVIVCLAAGYMVVYLIVVLVYMKIKIKSWKIWKTLEEQQLEMNNMMNVERQYYVDNDPRNNRNDDSESDGNETEEDVIDARRGARRAPNPPSERVHRPKGKSKRKIPRPEPPPPYEEVNSGIP